MTKPDIREQIAESIGDEDLIFFDGPGFDEAIVGIARRFGMPPVVAYSYEKIIAAMMAEGMDEGEAVEFFEFNTIGAWVGESTPVFIQQPYV